MRFLPTTLTASICFVVIGSVAPAADWPMWRHDARRSQASAQELPAKMELRWQRDLPALEPAWLDQPRMQLDAVYEPIVVGKRLYVGSSRFDTLSCYDTDTGKELWTFPAGGPVRFAPAAWKDRVYFACDDGYLYCLDGRAGTLLWKFRGGPDDRKILGNGRLISTWPARGAPVIADGTIYFTAGIWPFMGIFLHAVDAETGKAVWTNDGDGSMYIRQPHNSDSFAGVAPQGPLVVVGDKLLIPSRSAPACYDRRTGKLVHYKLAENSKKGGGSLIAASKRYIFNGGAVFELETGKYKGTFASSKFSFGKAGALQGYDEPFAVGAEVMHVSAGSKIKAFDLEKTGIQEVTKVDRRGKKYKSKQWALPTLGELPLSGARVLIQAGDQLVVGCPGKIVVVDWKNPAKPAVAWEARIEGTPGSLIAADDKLFVVTRAGRLYCFAGIDKDKAKPIVHSLPETKQPRADEATKRARNILDTTGVRGGYAVAWGAGSGRLVAELARQSQLNVIVIEPDAKLVDRLRAELHAANVPCQRVAFVNCEPGECRLPPYLAGLMVSEDLEQAGIELDKSFLRVAYRSLRPYGGVFCLPDGIDADTVKDQAGLAKLVKAKLQSADGLVLLSRDGALPGSANWTHEQADAANTRVSRDELVKAPLGVLWFGGHSHEGVLPRHGHGPQPQVVDGRLYIEGVHMIRCLDIYTGQVLWEVGIPGLGKYFDNSSHQPGANAAGANFISTSDGIYVATGAKCLRLDPVTGKMTGTFQLPGGNGSEHPAWGYINVVGDYLIGGADPLVPDLKVPPRQATGDLRVIWPVKENLGGALAFGSLGAWHSLPYLLEAKEPADAGLFDRLFEKLGIDDDLMLPAKKLAKLRGSENDTYSASKQLVVMERATGKVLWTADARFHFRHNAICVGGGRLYAIDRMSGAQISRLKRRGLEPEGAPRLVAFDLDTGKQLWSTDDKVFGSALSYSKEHDVLVEAGFPARDTLRDEARGMRTFRAATGKPIWHNAKLHGPVMLHGDSILLAGKGCDLLTGKPKTRIDPITGATIDWEWSRNYGCNMPIASTNLLTFRSGAAGFFDLCNDGGTGNFGGFRSSCTNNLIVAGGVLCAPDYTRTCTCSYQNQTSIALVHMPDAELWTFNDDDIGAGVVERVGVNLAAPGDRKIPNGSLWLDYPSVGGRSPKIDIEVEPKKPSYFRRHSSQVDGPLPWVASSGARDIRKLEVAVAKGVLVTPRKYTVRLYFVEPDDVEPGVRVFDVAVQGATVLRDLDVRKETGGRLRSLVKEVTGVKSDKTITITLTPAADCELREPILCGVEIVRETDD